MLSRSWHTVYGACLAAGAIALGLVVLTTVSVPQVTHHPADDGWRRTADGWQRITAQWQPSRLALEQPRLSTARLPRLDTHPAALALVQIVCVVWGFYAFPRPLGAPRRRSAASWRSLLARSFRASAFG